MRLVTLEGLPKVCEDVMNVLHRNKIFTVVPSPMVPLSTSVQCTAGDTMATALSNLFVRLKTLRRMNLASSTLIGGCHWIESPSLTLKERSAFQRLVQEITRALTDHLDLTIKQHALIVMKSSVHECFEYLLTDMEARDLTVDDLLQESSFLDMITHIPGAASAFPYIVYHVSCPPYMQDNEHEINTTAQRIASIVKLL